MIKNSLRSRMLRYGIGLFALANTLQANAQLELTLQPEKSMGFAAWEEPVVSSTLSIYEKEGSSYKLITSETTNQNYIRIDSVYFNTPNYYYRIVGTQSDNSTLETGYVPALPIGGTEYAELDVKVCNGKSYAYELVAFQNEASNNVRLKARSTDNFYDPNTLVWIPYFQAIAKVNWNLTPTLHPYKFQHKSVILNGFVNSTTLFYDKMGAPVTDGYLVEKRFDQFGNFNTASTVYSADFPITITPTFTGLGGWIDFFNTHVDVSTYNTAPINWGYYSLTTAPSGLECIEPYGPPPVPDLGESWIEWYKKYRKLVLDMEKEILTGGGMLTSVDLEDIIHTVYVDDTDEVYTTGVMFKKFKADPYINLVKNGNSLDVHSASSTIPAGLYEVNVFSNTGSVLPLYIDLKYGIPISPLKDYATVSITPNPIVGNDLTVNIKNRKAGAVTVELYDINGNLVHTDGFTMTEKEVDKHYDIIGYRLPSDLVVVKVSFMDGSFTTLTGTR